MKYLEIYRLMGRLTGRPSSAGCRQLAQAAVLLLQMDSFPERRLMSDLYLPIAQRNRCAASSVARSLARAAEDCWQYGDRELLEHVAGRRLPEKPSPGELLLYLYQYLQARPPETF